MGQLIWQFATNNTIGNLIVRFGTRCNWSHVDCVLPDGNLLGSLPPEGVKIRKPGEVKFSRTQRVMIQTDLVNDIHTHLYSQIGKPYDWRGVIAFGIGDRDWRDDEAWFCSELQIWAAEKAGFFSRHLNVPTDRLSPRDQWLLFSPYYDLVI